MMLTTTIAGNNTALRSAMMTRRFCRVANTTASIASSSSSSSFFLIEKKKKKKGANNSSNNKRFFTTTTTKQQPIQKEEFRNRGLLDEWGMTVFETLHELQKNSSIVFENNELFGTHDPTSNGFKYMTYGEYNEKVLRCQSFLKNDLGIGENDKVAIISNNRWEWATIAAATYGLNATIVPMYEAQLPSDWAYILNDSGAKAVFSATKDIYDRVQKEVLPITPTVDSNYCLDVTDDDDDNERHSFDRALSLSSLASNENTAARPPTPDDLAGLIYTSGTTGKPKGVELTHSNFVSNVKGATRSLVTNPLDFIQESDRSLSFLPWAHSYGQTCELWSMMSSGASMGICRGVPVILEDLQLVKPTNLFSVPTLYKKVYDGVHNLIESAPPLRKKLMKSALSIGRERVSIQEGTRSEPMGLVERAKFSALDKLVLSKIRDRFGGNLQRGFSGGAACPAEVLTFMDTIGIPVCEGYGLTETSPIMTLNVPEKRKLGSVGQPLGGVTVLVVNEKGQPVPVGEEGELCCVGPNVMRGYYNNKEATDKVISTAPDGKSRMFHTGDMGRMDEHGWVSVTGRIKEQYKLENGKYVVPAPIESAIGMSRFINQVVLCGANRPFNVALIVPEWPAILAELAKNDAAENNNTKNTNDQTDADDNRSEELLANDPNVKKLIKNEIVRSCEKLKKFEIPKRFAFVAPFTAANNMLTPKMSIRRHKVMSAYDELISSMYENDQIVTEAADGYLRDEAA